MSFKSLLSFKAPMFLKLLLWIIRLMMVFLVVVSLLPLVPSGQWWIRVWDFPRLQLTVLLVLPLSLLAIHAWRSRQCKEHKAWLAVIVMIAGWHAWHILPFTAVWATEVPTAQAEPDRPHPTLKVLTANVTFANDHYAEILNMVEQEDPDILLLIEVDSALNEGLASLDEEYAHRVGEVREEGLGIVMWSRIPLLEKGVEHLVSERRPSVFATLDMPEVGPVRFIGAHPVPPGLLERNAANDDEERQDSRERDAELMLIARHVQKDPDNRWIVAGDFNDVAWSRTTKLFAELSDLKDPRRGRRLLSTYHAERPWWRYPIDHMFVSDGFHLIDIDRVRVQGSDHFGILTTLTAARKDQAKPEASEGQEQEAEEIVEEGEADAAESGAGVSEQ